MLVIICFLVEITFRNISEINTAYSPNRDRFVGHVFKDGRWGGKATEY